jgi:hypothetical protein
VNKTPDPGEVVRDRLVPAAEELIASLAERVGPVAKEAVDQVTPMALAAAEKTVALAHVAAEKVAPLTHQALDAVTPLAQQTRDAVTPYAQQAADVVGPYASRVGPLAQQAGDRVGPLAQQAAVAVAPYAALLVEQGRRSGHDLADRLEPALEAAREAFAGAREKVTAEYVPAVGAAAAAAAASASPLVSAATERGKALVQSVTSEPVVVVPPPKKKRGWLAGLAVVAAAAGATYVVVRKLAGDKGSQWQTARPSTPYAPPVSAEAGVAAPTTGAEPPAAGPTDVVASTTSLYGTVGSDATGGAVDDTDASAIAARNEEIDTVAAVDDGTEAPPAAGRTSGTWGEGSTTEPAPTYAGEPVEQDLETAEQRVVEEPEDAVSAEQDTAMGGSPAEHPERYDRPGVYVGVEPPVGYTIKGNERSMKYHLPDSNSYGRTIAEVWFDSEEAARQAGFTRAQH